MGVARRARVKVGAAEWAWQVRAWVNGVARVGGIGLPLQETKPPSQSRRAEKRGFCSMRRVSQSTNLAMLISLCLTVNQAMYVHK